MPDYPRLTFLVVALAVVTASVRAAPTMEHLDRGVVAVHQPDGKVYVSWRLLASDPDGTAYNVYRTTAAPAAGAEQLGQFGPPPPSEPATMHLNAAPLAGPTWLLDAGAHLERATTYTVRPVVQGVEGPADAGFTLPAGVPPLPYHSIHLQTPRGYAPNDGSVGDLDGDGQYEIVLHQAGRGHDNSQAGLTDPPILQAYKLDGTLLWTIHLGRNIREGAHYTQFLVYDFDGDGRAEVVCKTADGTVDGQGRVIGDPNADWREPAGPTVSSTDATGAVRTPTGFAAALEGRILRGPEYLTVFDGRTGAALATTR
ncbi:MAG: hypothetical protein JSR48_13985, partial [Verrucomicrobia bacterium]|nr:hypothetical protein [Verrucomicrobiota bacterium]